jgi:hypothetical protein
MRYLKRTTLNNKTITGNRDLYIDQSGEIVINLPYSLTLPRGSNEDQSPDDSTLPSYVNGMIRYNTDTAEFEGYQAGAWRSFRFKEPSKVILQDAGTGNAVETVFPLTPDPFTYYATTQSGMTWNATQMAKNLVVYVGQVPQVGSINFTVEQSASGSLSGPSAPYADGTYIKFGTPPPNAQKVYVFHGYDQ